MMDGSDALKDEAIETLAWAGTILRPASEAGRTIRDLVKRLQAPGASLGPGEGSRDEVGFSEVRDALDRDWPAGSDLAEAVAGLVGRLPADVPSPSP